MIERWPQPLDTPGYQRNTMEPLPDGRGNYWPGLNANKVDARAQLTLTCYHYSKYARGSMSNIFRKIVTAQEGLRT